MSTPTTFFYYEDTLRIRRGSLTVTVQGWPGLRAYRREEEAGRWIPFQPQFRLVYPYYRTAAPRKQKSKPEEQLSLMLGDVERAPSPTELRNRALNGFRFSLPREAAARVERFSGRQWQLLMLFQEEPGAVEVCASNPALVFAVANAQDLGLRHSLPLDHAAALVRRKQREILPWLGFPDSASVARMLGRLVPESVNGDTLGQLRQVLEESEKAKWLSHLRRINQGVLALLADPELSPLCAPTLLEEVAATPAEKYRATAADRLATVVQCQRQLDPGRALPRLQGLAQLQQLHDELQTALQRHAAVLGRNLRFPAPPLAGTPNIVPLTSETSLIEEGRLQHNCVGSYGDRVMAKAIYIYRVLAPERATLSIMRGPDGQWEIGELELACNRPVAPATEAVVQAWLEGHHRWL